MQKGIVGIYIYVYTQSSNFVSFFPWRATIQHEYIYVYKNKEEIRAVGIFFRLPNWIECKTQSLTSIWSRGESDSEWFKNGLLSRALLRRLLLFKCVFFFFKGYLYSEIRLLYALFYAAAVALHLNHWPFSHTYFYWQLSSHLRGQHQFIKGETIYIKLLFIVSLQLRTWILVIYF